MQSPREKRTDGETLKRVSLLLRSVELTPVERMLCVFYVTTPRESLAEDVKKAELSRTSVLKALRSAVRAGLMPEEEEKEARDLFNERKDLAGEDKLINQLMSVFYVEGKNRGVPFHRKDQRKAALQLIRAYGFSEACSMASRAISVQGQPYAPVITTPVTLWAKQRELQVYFERRSASSHRSAVI